MCQHVDRFILVSLLVLTCSDRSDIAIAQPMYEATDLGTLQNGAANSWAWDINEVGQVVGYADAPNGQSIHAFFWANGEMVDLKTLGTPYSWAYGINNRTQITGYSGVDSLTIHGFLWQDGIMLDLGSPPFGRGTFSRGNDINDDGAITGICHSSRPGMVVPYTGFRWFEGTWTELPSFGGADGHGYAINDAGDVAGWAEYAPPEPQAPRSALWIGDKIIDLGALGRHQSWAEDLNSRRQIVGWSFDDEGFERAFLWQAGNMNELGTLGGSRSQAYGINHLGEIVGGSETAADGRHAFFIDIDGTMHDLNGLVDPPLDVVLRSARSINDMGQIAANAERPDGTKHAYLLTPADLPRIESPQPGRTGTRNTYRIRNAAPNARVILLYSIGNLKRSDIPGCNATLNIDRPQVLGKATADPNGDAELSVLVPAWAARIPVVYQLVDATGCRVSPLMWYTYP